MLTDEPTVRAVIDTLTSHYSGSAIPPLVVDPVMVSTMGHSLLESSATALIKAELLPLAAVVTPNVPEGELILGLECGSIKSAYDMMRTAEDVSKLGARATLLKGGHCELSSADVLTISASTPADDVYVCWSAGCGLDQPLILRPENFIWVVAEEMVVVDVLYLPDPRVDDVAKYTLLVRPRLETTGTHGTGCKLSAALACALAQGLSPLDATIRATRYSHQAIAAAPKLRKGHGPLKHGHSTIARIVPQPTPVNPYPFTSALINSCSGLWSQYVEHLLVTQIAAGTLLKENCVHYLKQDYIYLKHYARAHGLLAAKASTYAASGTAATIVLRIVRESQMHVDYCTQWGVTPADLAATPNPPATTAYARYILDVGLQGDDFMLIIAVASCLLGYAEIGKKLKLSGEASDDNPYKRWVDDYSGAEFQEALQRDLDLMEERAAADPPSAIRFAQLQDVWERCVRLEIGFWNMGLNI